MSTRYKIIAAVMIVLTLVAGCGKAGPTATPVPPTATSVPTLVPMPTAPHPFDTAWDDRAIFREGLIDAEQEVLDRLPGASVYHIDFQITDDFLLLEGHEKVHYTYQEDDPSTRSTSACFLT